MVFVVQAAAPAPEPVAMRYDFDGYGWRYIDTGSGSDWMTRHPEGELLYAGPAPAVGAAPRPQPLYTRPSGDEVQKWLNAHQAHGIGISVGEAANTSPAGHT
jgi:hypothetical protein